MGSAIRLDYYAEAKATNLKTGDKISDVYIAPIGDPTLRTGFIHRLVIHEDSVTKCGAEAIVFLK